MISGLLEASGEAPLGVFEISRVGLPVALVGIVAVVLLAPLLLPERRSAHREIDEDFREFVVNMLVDRGGADGGRFLVPSDEPEEALDAVHRFGGCHHNLVGDVRRQIACRGEPDDAGTVGEEDVTGVQ